MMNMQDFSARIKADPRYAEACRSCMSCGVCTAICPAAGYFDYDPRVLMNRVADADESSLEELLGSDLIWYCGQCMSCKPRCPRSNVPGILIQILRAVSLKSGLFTQSRLGRQQLAIKRAIGHNILETGYCVHPTRVDPLTHPEQGPVWAWMSGNADRVYGRFDQGYDRSGPGLLRKINPLVLSELERIFEVTGCTDLWQTIETESEKYSQTHPES